MPIFRRSPAWLCIALLGFVLSSAAQTLETKPCSFCLRAAVDIVHQLEGEGEGGGGLTQAWRKLHDVAISEAWAETNWTRATRKFVQHLGATHTLLQTDVVPDRLAFQNVARATESLLHGLEPAKFCSLIGACPSCPLRAEVPSHLKRDFDLVMAVTKFAAGAGRAQQQDLGTRKGRVGVVPGTNRSEPTVLLSLGSSLRLRHRSRTAIEMRAAAKMGAAAEMEVSHLLALHGKCRDTDPDVAVPTAAAVPAVLPPHTTTSVVFASLNVENMAAFGASRRDPPPHDHVQSSEEHKEEYYTAQDDTAHLPESIEVDGTKIPRSPHIFDSGNYWRYGNYHPYYLHKGDVEFTIVPGDVEFTPSQGGEHEHAPSGLTVYQLVKEKGNAEFDYYIASGIDGRGRVFAKRNRATGEMTEITKEEFINA